jgi:hypothetical protein
MPPNKSSKRKRIAGRSSAAVKTQLAAITPTISSPITAAFAVKCSRKSELVDTDDACFVDCWNEEVDDAQEAAEESATAYDGTWVWDSEPIKSGCEFYDYRVSTSERSKSFAGGGGVPVLFKDQTAAEAAAFNVWQAMLQAQERPSKPVLQQLEQQALGITDRELKLKADERHKQRHHERREQHDQEMQVQRQEYLHQLEQQVLLCQEQQQQLLQVQKQEKEQEKSKQRRRRGRQQQQQQPEEQDPLQQLQQQQLLMLLQQQSYPAWQTGMYDPYFRSRTPTPERRMQPSTRSAAAAAAATAAATADSDTDSVRAAKKEAADINAAVSAGDQQAYLQLLSRFKSVSAEGLSAWQADVDWLSDPWADVGRETINNVVLTTVRVEVIKARIV